LHQLCYQIYFHRSTGPSHNGFIVLAASLGYLTSSVLNKVVGPAKFWFRNNFVETEQTYPALVEDAQTIWDLTINMLAGADVTRSLSELLRFTLKDPLVYEQLQEEGLAASIAESFTTFYE